MKNNRVLVTGELERNFGLCGMLAERGLSANVVRDDGQLLMEEIVNKNPKAVMLPSFMPLQDAVGVISMAKSLKGDRDDTLYFVMGNGEGVKTINYIMNNGADYYFHMATQTKVIAEKVRSFVEEDSGQSDTYLPDYSFALPPKADRDTVIRELLRAIGIMPHLKGFVYIQDALDMNLKSASGALPLTRVIYPALAKRYETTELRVERAIRNAIMVAWANYQKIQRNSYRRRVPIFSAYEKRPSNREFLGQVMAELKKILPSPKKDEEKGDVEIVRDTEDNCQGIG